MRRWFGALFVLLAVAAAALMGRTPAHAFGIYPAGSTSFTLYDGSDIRCVANDATATVTVTASARPLLLQIHRLTPASVTRDGASLPQAATQAAFDAATEAWRADVQMLLVKFAHSGGSSTIQAS